MKKQLMVGVIALIALTAMGTLNIMTVQSSPLMGGKAGFLPPVSKGMGCCIAAPIAISGENVYIVWPTNRTGNDEVNFRASTDGGVTFADKINLSNSTNADSQDVEIAAGGDNVVITWWERNQTAQEPVVRVSTDNGATFGPLLRLANNGTIGDASGAG